MCRPGGCGGPACRSPSSPRLGGGRPARSTGEGKLEPPPGLLPRRQQQKQNRRAALTGSLPTGFSPSFSLHPSRVTAPWQPYKPLLSSLGKQQQWVWEPEAIPLSPAAGTSGFSDPGAGGPLSILCSHGPALFPQQEADQVSRLSGEPDFSSHGAHLSQGQRSTITLPFRSGRRGILPSRAHVTPEVEN